MHPFFETVNKLGLGKSIYRLPVVYKPWVFEDQSFKVRVGVGSTAVVGVSNIRGNRPLRFSIIRCGDPSVQPLILAGCSYRCDNDPTFEFRGSFNILTDSTLACVVRTCEIGRASLLGDYNLSSMPGYLDSMNIAPLPTKSSIDKFLASQP